MLFENRIDKILYLFTPGSTNGIQRGPRGHLEVAAIIKKWAQNSPENDPNLSIRTPGTRKLQISSHSKIIQKSNFYKSHIFRFKECQWGSKGRFRDPKMSRKFHQNAPRWLGADLRIAQRQSGGSFSPLRTSWKVIVCAFESWDRARQHSKDTGAHNKSSAVQNLKMHVARRRHRAEHQNSPAHPSTVTRFARARGLLCIFASIHQWPPRAFSCCSSCPQGFI